jgi:two-component system cell cycle sensor histidine kinase/response regulator CckA
MALAARNLSAAPLSPGFNRREALGIAEFALNNALFDHTSDAISLLTPEGVILDVNRRWETLSGIPRQQMIGQHIREFAAAGSEEANTDTYRRTLDGSLQSAIVPIAGADGARIYMEFLNTMIPAGSGHVVLAIGRDVTSVVLAREQVEASERRYRLLIEKVPEIVWLATLEGQIIFMSPKVQAVCGFSAADLVAAPASFWFDRIHPSDRAGVQREFAQLATYGGYEAEYRWQRKDGAWIWIHAQAVVALEQDGSVVAEGTFQDITTRKHLEDQVRQSQKMEAIGRLTGGVAHDFNNLLAIILGNGRLLLDDLAEQDPRREDADAILEAGNRAAALTRQLLMFSRHQVVRPECLEVNKIVRGVDKMLCRIIGEDVELRLQLADHAGNVMADAGELEQVIMNLVVNARDAMPRGGHVTIDTTNVTIDAEYAGLHPGITAGRYVVLSVTDTGCGMDQETKRRAFEPFFTTKDKANGTGLGLSTCYGIIRGCHGHISVYSEVGVGSVFKVYLPLHECLPSGRARGETRGDVHGTESVLLIEDDDQLRKTIRRVLESRGYTVIDTNGSAEAIEYCESHQDHIDLVLSDMVMPGMSGPETVEIIQQHRPGAKVLFMSGYSDHAVFRDRSAQGQVNFIQKPFMPQDLALKVRQVLDSSPRTDRTIRVSSNALG